MAAHISRQKAQLYSGFAAVLLLGGTLAAAYAIFAAPTEDPGKNLTEKIAVAQPQPDRHTTPEKPAEPRKDFDGRGASARLALIKNHPVIAEATAPEEHITPEEHTTPEALTEVVKYLGPVRMGSLTMALIGLEDKQRPVIRGKSFSHTADGSTRNFRLVDVSDDSITIEEEGKERTIAKAGSSGDVISYIGNRPSRGKAVVLSKKSGKSQNPGDNPAADAASDARAKILSQYGSMIQATLKAKGELPRDLRDKLIEVMKSQNLDPSEIDNIVKEKMAEISK